MKQRVEVVCPECSGSGQRQSDFYNRPCGMCRGRRTVVCEVAPEPSAELTGMLVAAVPALLSELRAIREALQALAAETAKAAMACPRREQ